MMTGEELKASILQMAMQGKLVEQRPEEGTGEELYQEIQKEKQKLVKEGKIKKGKKAAPISDDEIPFDIPETWVWVRLGEITESMNDGVHFAPKYISSGVPCYSAKDINCDKISDANVNYISEMDYENLMGYKIKTKDGSILITKSGSIGRSVVLDKWYKFGLVESVGVINLIQTNPYFIKAIFDYGFVNTNRFFDLYTKGIAVKHLTLSVLGTVVIPLPPLAEQKRIVAKIEELLPFVDQYTASSEKLNTLNITFPDQMKKSILQEAVQGKLVPQDPSDEPAGVLLEKIAEEKKELIKEGKIKKQKPLPTITEEDIPFEIPESWEWVHFSDLFCLSNGIASRGTVGGTKRPVLRLADLTSGQINIESMRDIALSEKEFNTHTISEGDLVFIRVNGSREKVANAFLYTGKQDISYCDHLFCGHKVSSLFDSVYIMYVYHSNMVRKQVSPEIKTTAGQNTINQKSMGKIIIPLPPLAEQKRIVARLDKLFGILEKPI